MGLARFTREQEASILGVPNGWAVPVLLCVVAVVGLTVVSPAPARGASRDINSTIKLAHVEDFGSPPISGSANYAGTFKGVLGSGAIVGHLTYAAPDFDGTFRVFLNKGSFKGTLKGSGDPASGESIDISGSGVIRKGAAKYKGAHGEFTFSGSQTPESGVATLAIRGSLEY